MRNGVLALDVGQSGIRSILLREGIGERRRDLEGVRTSEPLGPQIISAIRSLVEMDEVSQVSVGATGLTSAESAESVLLECADLGVRRVILGHDSVSSFLGALGDAEGVVSAVGTGVVTLAVGRSQAARVDGWGHLIGDAGSGFWIGRAALDAVLRHHDGRGKATALSEVVRQDFPHLDEAYIELQSDPDRVRRIAQYARAVSDLAEEDKIAARICRQAAGEVAASIVTAATRAGLGDGGKAPTVCGLGGVLRGRVLTELQSALKKKWRGARLIQPDADGLVGAIRMVDLERTSPLRALIGEAKF